MNFGAIALVIDGIMTGLVGAALLHKLRSTGETVNAEIEKGVQQLIDNAPEIVAAAMGVKTGDDNA